jgi:hypothetical protein
MSIDTILGIFGIILGLVGLIAGYILQEEHTNKTAAILTQDRQFNQGQCSAIKRSSYNL